LSGRSANLERKREKNYNNATPFCADAPDLGWGSRNRPGERKGKREHYLKQNRNYRKDTYSTEPLHDPNDKWSQGGDEKGKVGKKRRGHV